MQNQSFTNSARSGYNSLPDAIKVIISINVVVYLVQWIGSIVGGQSFSLFVRDWFAFFPDALVTVTQPWRLVSYMFLHGGFFHLLFNMLWLWWMGRSVEERLGPRTFCAIYFGSGIGGALLDVLLAQVFGIAYVVGASGAVFGVMVAFAMLYPRMPIMLILLPPIEARYVVAGLIGLNLLALGGESNVAHVVHLGGAGFGYLLMKAWQNGFDLSSPIRTIEGWWLRLKGAYEKPKSPKNKNMYAVSDVEVIEEVEQSELDEILEKISKKGYEALTKAEKKKLFELSKKN
jgi:membrane associated rhomboid family serine protease